MLCMVAYFCLKHYVNIQHNYVNMQFIHVNLQLIYVNMQLFYVNKQYNYVILQDTYVKILLIQHVGIICIAWSGLKTENLF